MLPEPVLLDAARGQRQDFYGDLARVCTVEELEDAAARSDEFQVCAWGWAEDDRGQGELVLANDRDAAGCGQPGLNTYWTTPNPNTEFAAYCCTPDI